LKMDLTEGSETSANINQTQGNHPKVDILNTEHGESLKSRINITTAKFEGTKSPVPARDPQPLPFTPPPQSLLL
jgi:hypothetical protein